MKMNLKDRLKRMTTKDEVRSTVEAFRTERALKLALEALEPMEDSRDDTAIQRAITAIEEALADSALERMAENERELGIDYMQPAEIPQSITCPFCESQHVPGWLHDYNMDRMKKPAPVAKPHKQQEPVAWVETREDGSIYYGVETDTVISDDPSWLERPMPVYTSPPASPSQGDIKPWVGLDSQDFDGVIKSDAFEAGAYWANNILREKNENMEKNA